MAGGLIKLRNFLNANSAAVLAALAIVMNTIVVGDVQPAQSGVKFGANLTANNACSIVIRNGGTMVQSPSATQMSSMFAGGQSGVADVFAIFPYEISVSPPPFFTTRPPGGENGVTYKTWFSGQALNARGANFPTQEGSIPVQLSRYFSYTRLTVDLEANRPDPFPSGDYATYATVRCE